MSYEEILKELEEVNLKDKLTTVYEGFVSDSFLERLRNTDKIHSTGSLIRSLLIFFENESEEWLYWQKVLFYFMTPVFERKENQLL